MCITLLSALIVIPFAQFPKDDMTRCIAQSCQAMTELT